MRALECSSKASLQSLSGKSCRLEIPKPNALFYKSKVCLFETKYFRKGGLRAVDLKLYDILNVPHDASFAEILVSYNNTLNKLKQLREGSDEEAWKLKYLSVSLAYEVLSDSHTRYYYDILGLSSLTGRLATLLGLLKEFSKRDKKQGKRDIKESIDLETAAKGGRMAVQYLTEGICRDCNGQGHIPGNCIICVCCHGTGSVLISFKGNQGEDTVTGDCPACGGHGLEYHAVCITCKGHKTVNIKKKLNIEVVPGLKTGSVLKIRGQGNASVLYTEPGDLYIGILINKHKSYRISGNDIYSTIRIPYHLAILGGSVCVRTVWGMEIIEIPYGIQQCDSIVIKDRGMIQNNGSGRGSHIVCVKIIIPRDLNIFEKSMFEKLRDLQNLYI